MINKVVIIGRLTKDPDIRKAGDTILASFSIACDRNYKDKDGNKVTDFIECKAWRNTANFLEKYSHKGMLIAVEGSINQESYTDKDGKNRSYLIVLADSVQPLESATVKDIKNAEERPISELGKDLGFDDFPF